VLPSPVVARITRDRVGGSGGPLPDGGSSAYRTCGVTLDHVA